MADMEQWLDEDAILPHEEDWRDAVPSWFKQPLPDEPHVRQLIFDLSLGPKNRASPRLAQICLGGALMVFVSAC